jgi:hypothetical protein
MTDSVVMNKKPGGKAMTDPNKIQIPEAFAKRMFFTSAEVGEIAGRDKLTIARCRRLGFLNAAHFRTQCAMIPRTEVERFIRGEIDFSKPPAKKGEQYCTKSGAGKAPFGNDCP